MRVRIVSLKKKTIYNFLIVTFVVNVSHYMFVFLTELLILRVRKCDIHIFQVGLRLFELFDKKVRVIQFVNFK